MRDDIHNKAPISQILRSLLRRCLREADRQDAEKLTRCAKEALSHEIAKAIPQNRLDRLSKAANEQLMFCEREISIRPQSRFEADFVAVLNRDSSTSPSEALENACAAHITRLARETEAALIAAEPHSGKEIAAGVTAFRSALTSAISDAACVSFEGDRTSGPVAPITAETRIPSKPPVERSHS